MKAEFEKTVKKVKELKKEIFETQKNFLKNNRLSECFNWMLRAEIEDNVHYCYFDIKGLACSVSKAEELKEMGFHVEIVKDNRDVLTGWIVRWDAPLIE